MTKLANPVGRSTPEWCGKTADTWPPPEAVQLRVMLRQDGRCTLTGHKFSPGDEKQLDHTIALADWRGEGHGNCESNLQWILDGAHKAKTGEENSDRAKVKKRAKTHAGIVGKQPVKPIDSDPAALKSQRRPKHEGRAPANGMPALMRQGFVPVGDLANDVLAKITPKKTAAE